MLWSAKQEVEKEKGKNNYCFLKTVFKKDISDDLFNFYMGIGSDYQQVHIFSAASFQLSLREHALNVAKFYDPAQF
jgi:hypothetical protein